MSAEIEDLNILLYIAQGTGLDLGEGSVILTATLGGNTLETKPVEACEKVEFNSHLIWETNKKSIKRMKTENLPIKVECFMATTRNCQEVRNLIGYILIPIRGIPIILSKKAKTYRAHSHRLVGLSQEWKSKKPEISLYLSITEKAYQHDAVYDEPESAESRLPSGNNTVEMLSSQKGLYIELLQQEGLLQVGNKERDCDIFIVKLMFKSARNLEQMVNPEEDMHELFRFSYNLLGTAAFCALTPKGNGIFNIQEKIAINFRTSLQSLREYFRRVFYIPLELYYNDSVVGNAQFHFRNVLTVKTLDEFLDRYSTNDNTFTIDDTFPIQTLFDLPPSSPVPFLEFVFSLKYMSTTKVGNCEIIMDEPQKAEFIDNNACGDMNAIEEYRAELPPTPSNRDQESFRNRLNMREIQSDSIVASVRQMEIHQEKSENNVKSVKSQKIIEPVEKSDVSALINEKCPTKTTKDAPRTFSFNLILQTVKFNRRPEVGIWQLSLHHQNADTSYTIANVELTEINSNLIEFKNLELQLFFSTNVDSIFDLVSSESCILKINGPRGIHAFAELDNEILLVSTKEKRSGVILMENQIGEKCAMAHIFVYIEDLGITFNSQIKRHTNLNTPSSKPYLDENLAYQMVEELEQWKEREQENFLVELKRREINHLAMLSIDWQKRKSELETELTNKLEHCTNLSDTLEEAHKALKEKGLDYFEHQQLLEKERKLCEYRYTKIIEEINEKNRRNENDLQHRLKLEELKYKGLELEKLNLEKEKLTVEKDLDELKTNFNEMRRNYLPREQLAGLFQDVKILNERLDEVQKSKQFYKEQWAKIIREVHKLKSENLQKIEEKILNGKATGLQNLLQSEKAEFYNERSELNEVKAVLHNSSDDDDSESFYEFDR